MVNEWTSHTKTASIYIGIDVNFDAKKIRSQNMTKYARFEAHGEIAYGVLDEHKINQITGTPFGEHDITSHTHEIDEVKLLSPVKPGKVVAIGLNYKSHLGDKMAPKVPEPFLKTATSVIAHEDNIVIPRLALIENVKVQPEAELGVVIGTKCKSVDQSDALNYVFGYTCGNDVSGRDWQENDLQWWRAKSSDTFTPLGPYMVTGLDPTNIQVQCRVNGKEEQNQNTSDLIHPITRIIEFVSSVMTLEEGDVILTGTPGTPGDIHPGDVVEVEVSGIGILRNSVVAE